MYKCIKIHCILKMTDFMTYQLCFNKTFKNSYGTYGKILNVSEHNKRFSKYMKTLREKDRTTFITGETLTYLLHIYRPGRRSVRIYKISWES